MAPATTIRTHPRNQARGKTCDTANCGEEPRRSRPEASCDKCRDDESPE